MDLLGKQVPQKKCGNKEEIKAIVTNQLQHFQKVIVHNGEI